VNGEPVREFEINGRKVGPGRPTYIVAEMSANHGGNFDTAVRIVRAAKAAGADAIKLQTYTPDTLTICCDAPPFKIAGGTLWDGRTLYELYADAATPWEWHPKLMRVAVEEELDCFSTAFDESAVEFLERLGVPIHKAASFELVDLALIERLARTGKPLILSTGMATIEEITEAVETASRAGAGPLALLKCTSAYPAPSDEMNLRAIRTLAETFRVPIGLSDHTLGATAAVAAVALGACMLEKHLTLSREAPSADQAFSQTPEEFRRMVDAVREVERALGSSRFGPGPEESKSRVFRRSLFVVKAVRAGEALTARNVRSIRPGAGLAPRYLRQILGRRASRDIARGTPLTWDLVTGSGAGETAGSRKAA